MDLKKIIGRASALRDDEFLAARHFKIVLWFSYAERHE